MVLGVCSTYNVHCYRLKQKKNLNPTFPFLYPPSPTPYPLIVDWQNGAPFSYLELTENSIQRLVSRLEMFPQFQFLDV